MKNKIKDFLLIFGIGYMIVIVILMFISYFNSSKYIELSTTNEYDSILNEYKEKADDIGEESCKEYYINFINYIEKSKVKDKILVSDYFKNVFSDEPFLTYYSKGIEACTELTQEKARENSFPLLFLGASIQQDAILSEYSFQYELTLPDNLLRLIVKPSIGNVQDNIKYGNEVEIVKKIYDIVTEKEVIE